MMDRIEPGEPTMTPQEFIQRWRNVGFGERQAAYYGRSLLYKAEGTHDCWAAAVDGWFAA